MELNPEMLFHAFPKPFVLKVKKEYEARIKNLKNHEYFDSPGEYTGRNLRYVTEGISEHFENLLYGTNIAILDYCLHNDLTGLRVVDYGAGVGVLGMFLERLGVNCYNYDDYSQTGFHPFSTDILPDAADVLCVSAIWAAHPNLPKMGFKILLADSNTSARSPICGDYELKGNYHGLLNIYERPD